MVSIAEGLPTVLTPFKLAYEVVTEESAKIEVGDFYKLADDHLGICKPGSKQSFLYQRLVEVIRKALDDPTSQNSQQPEEEGQQKSSSFSRDLWTALKSFV